MRNDKALPLNFFWQSLVTVLHIGMCLDYVQKYYNPFLYGTYFRTDMLKHLVRLPEQCFQFTYIEFHSN